MATFHGFGTCELWGGAWRQPGRRRAHRCPGPSSCLLCQIKSGLLFSPFSPLQQTRQSPLPFSLLCLLSPLVPFFSPWPLIRDWICCRMTEAGSALRHRRSLGAPGPGPELSTVLSVYQGLRHSWPGLALRSQSLAFSLDSHRRLSVRLAQSQQPPPTDLKEEGALHIQALPSYHPGDDVITCLSINRKVDLLHLLRLDYDP